MASKPGRRPQTPPPPPQPQQPQPEQQQRRWDKLLTFQHFQTTSLSKHSYGYVQGSMKALIESEFSRLRGITYLDHAGTTLFPQSQLTKFMDDLTKNIYGNPHSQHISSKLTYDTIEHVRYRVLEHFNTTSEDYSIIFTSGSTAAFKLVAEAFPWKPASSEDGGSRFCYLTDSHTSVVGIRKIVQAMQGSSIAVKPEDILLSEKSNGAVYQPACKTPHLFCYPAQSNFSGTRYPLSWIEVLKSGRLSPMTTPGEWFVLLDAAAYVSTSSLDLAAHPADFIPISFYKIFGFPTGLGALLVNNRVAHFLRKTYFGGGTAAAYLAGEDFYVPRKSVSERFEDGTISFLDIIALKHGFDVLERLTGGMENIKQHTFALAHYTYTVLVALRYPNGAPVLQIYSDTEFNSPETQGPIINFNVLDDNGVIIGYSQIEKMASLHNIHVRTGCFCNTGACQRHLRISNETVRKNLQAGHICGDDIDLIDGHPTGSVRISFGYMSTFEDAQTFLKFIIATRLGKADRKLPFQITPGETAAISVEPVGQDERVNEHETGKLPQEDVLLQAELNNSSVTVNAMDVCPPETELGGGLTCTGAVDGGFPPLIIINVYIYPIKSCAALEVTKWPVGNQGLLYDRNWMVVNHNGICLSQKQEPRLCLIKPLIDLQQKTMVITAEGMEPIDVPLDENSEEYQICQSKVCADRVNMYDCGEKISEWLSKFFGHHCRLMKQSSNFKRSANKKHRKDPPHATTASLSLVNEAQYLLINRASVLELHQLLNASDENGTKELLPMRELIRRFRANIVINGTKAFEEEKWDEISIGSLHFLVLGPCHRCQMICIDQQNGQRNQDVFQTLSSIRERKVNFGVYLMHEPSDSSSTHLLSVGSQLLPVLKDIENNSSPSS
ncbi:LOW QUALITY PROTEIN: molybdenum cofactor sulfurase [Phascolarctos cinereus]|uniref:Molybdenum cofactor sulfurase n=1 Tax=Phascolarctos cinereus TaxID=38626 RepID=A0A6P5K9V5_PHACI|nr:LOW QUALITY PROTEIN: molybdenum cofactor sulfurase [Phascolarctos cinereus]